MYSQEVETPSQLHTSQRRQDQFPTEGLEEVDACKSDFEEVGEVSPQRRRPAKKNAAATTKKEDAVAITLETPTHTRQGQTYRYRSVSLSPSLVTEV